MVQVNFFTKQIHKYLKQTWLPKGKCEKGRDKAGTWDYYTCTTIYKIDNKDLLYSIGNHTQYSVITYMRKESEKRMNICEYITESLCCTPETNTKL